MKINKVLSLILAFAMILGTMTTVAFATENEKAEATMFSGPYEIVYKNVNTDKMFVDGSIYGLKESLKIVHWVTDKMEDVTFENIVSDNPELVDVNSSKEIDVKKTFTGVVTLTADATTEAGKKYKETIEVTTREIQADNDGKIGATSETIANAWDDFSALNGEQFFIGDFRELKDIYKIGFYAWDSEGNPVSVSGLAGLYTNNGWKGIDGASSTLSQITTSNVVTLFSGAMLNPYSDVLNIGFALTSEIEKDTTVMITVYNNMVSAPNYPRGNNQALAARSFKFVSNPVAKVGTAYYETLQAAATEAPDGATIEILGDTVENDWQQITDKSLTINGNGNTVTIDSVTNNTMLNGGALFRNTNNTANEANATLNISNTEFELPSGAVIAYIVDGTVDNVTVNGGKYGFVVEGATNFLGSTFNAQEKEAIYFRDVDGAPGSVVDGCTFNIENRRACALWTNEVFTNNTINTNNTEVTGLTILSDSSATVSGNVFGEDANIEIYVNGEESGTFSLTKNIIAGSVFTDGAEVSTQFENVNIENNSLSDEAVEGLKSIDEDVVSVNPAAEFNGKKYFSINEAIEAAKGSVNPEIKVLAGTYDAFEVPESLVNATFVGETDTNGNNLVTIRTLEEGIATHTGGIFVQAETATFENLDITSGEVSVNPRVGWMASALGVTNGDSGESSFLKNLTVENCNFEGSGAYQAMWLRLADVNVVNCTISGYAIGIETYPLGAEDEVNVVNTQITNVNNAIHSSDSVAGSKINVDNSIIDSNVIHIGGAVALSIENSTVKNADVTTYSASTFAVSNSKLYDTTYAVDENATGTITINENFANNVDTLIASADANDKIVYATYYPTEKDLDAKTNLTNVDKTSSIEVGFEATDDIREYDIVLKGTEGAINGFESAHFTFINNSDVDYTIAPNTDANITIVDDITNENRISFYMNADEKKPIEITSDYIKLGTVRFEGYGDVDFSIGSEDAKVNATTIVDSIVETFTTDANAVHKLIVNWTDADTTDEYVPNVKYEFVEQARKLYVDINFNNDITSKSADYTEMKVEVTGQNGEKHLGLIGEGTTSDTTLEVCDYATVANNAASLEFDVTAGYRYTVKVSGAGYRTAEYTTVIPTVEDITADAGVTLTFWNNVKDEFNKTEIESGSDRWYTKNFLAGEIVQDNKINKYDLAAVVSYFGEDDLVENRPEYNKYDLNRDGVIDSEDIAYVLVSFGE